jgi:hypothetical protein
MSVNKTTHEPTFKGSTKEIKSHFFYYGKGMQQKCLTSSKKFLSYIGGKFGESARQSINKNKIIITEMAEPKVYATEKEYTEESWSVENAWKLDTGDYRKYVRLVIPFYGNNVTLLYRLL